MIRFITTFVLAAAAGLFSVAARAQSMDETRLAFANQLYSSAASQVHHQQPQALLRAVVVLRVRLAADGRWTAEVMRENVHQPEMTRKALQSVAELNGPQFTDPALRDELQRNGFVEAWLFQTDGRFALKTLALPQKGV